MHLQDPTVFCRLWVWFFFLTSPDCKQSPLGSKNFNDCHLLFGHSIPTSILHTDLYQDMLYKYSYGDGLQLDPLHLFSLCNMKRYLLNNLTAGHCLKFHVANAGTSELA